MIAVFAHFLRRMARDGGLPGQSAAFFTLAIMACVFAIGSEGVLLAAILPGLAWAVLLLSSLLGLPDMLEGENLDDLIASHLPLPALMSAKAWAHWAATGLPLALIAPLALNIVIPDAVLNLPCLWIGFLLGSLCFSHIGLLGAALTLGSRRNAALQAIIVLPLCVPALIFGAGSAAAMMLDLGWIAPLSFLAAFACASVTLAPFAAAWIVRMKVVEC